jgi:hypothetical protein
MIAPHFCFFLYCIFNSAECQAVPEDTGIVPKWKITLAFFTGGIKMEGKEVLSMKISLSFVGDVIKRHRKLCTVALTVAALLGGTVLGAVLERNVGISLSDRLARRIGTVNAQVVSCVKSGSTLTVTLEFPNVSPEKETKRTPKEIKNGQFSPQNDLTMTSYLFAFEAVREELTSGPFSAGIDRVTLICRHGGETMNTLTGDRVPQNVGVSVDKTGKRIQPPPFSDFSEKNSDGTEGEEFSMFFIADSSQPVR